LSQVYGLPNQGVAGKVSAMDIQAKSLRDEIKRPGTQKLADVLGPGLITGASDDDPSGIATYSQAGAQYGYGLAWRLLLTYPLMCAIQIISAQIGRVTGRGLAGNMRRHYPAPLLSIWLVGVLVVANTINIGADLGAMAAALRQMARIQLDTLVGMGFSNIIALFIMLTTAATLNAHAAKDIQTSSQAAEALRPIAGDFTFAIFALGIIGTGLLALPVLAGSAAYAIGETMHWRVGLAQRPGRVKAFYGMIAAATFVGAASNFTPLDPFKALFWSAVINGVAAVPIMVMIMLLGSRRKVMRQFTLSPWLKTFGWLTTALTAAAAVGMFVTWGD
jgi:Mn2+/Fe2+ NRAMP family transporter